jgi:hypothetical protein
MKKRALIFALVLTLLVGAGLYWAVSAQAKSTAATHSVAGAGTSLVEGGTGAPLVPPGRDHLRLSLEQWAGPLRVPGTHAERSSGSCRQWQLRHQRNVRHRANHLGQRRGTTAVFKGTASVTGLGAGSNVPFEATAVAGGPGTTLVLVVSGLTFNEIVLAGQITVGK